MKQNYSDKSDLKKKEEEVNFAIPMRNFYYVLIGLGVMVLGYILMTGGGSDDPTRFNPAIFSFRRIVLAPIVIIAGIVLEIVAIMRIGKIKKSSK